MSPTVTLLPSGKVDLPFSSLFASSTALTTSDFSSSVSLFGSSTFTLSLGTFGSFLSASVFVFSTRSVLEISYVDLSKYVIVAFPLLSTVTVTPLSINVLFASSTFFLTWAFSSSLKLFKSFTGTFSVGILTVFTPSKASKASLTFFVRVSTVVLSAYLPLVLSITFCAAITASS